MEQYEENQESFNERRTSPAIENFLIDRSALQRKASEFDAAEGVGIDINGFLNNSRGNHQRIYDSEDPSEEPSKVDPRLREYFPFMNDRGEISLDITDKHRFVQ